jgi:glycerol kinase
MENLTIESARAFLESQGYYTRNLWHIMDVNTNQTDEEKMNILDDALSNGSTIQHLNEVIDITIRTSHEQL